MTALHIIFWRNSIIGHTLLFQRIHCISFLQQRIPYVLFVAENLFDIAFMPLGISRPVQDAVRLKSTFDLKKTPSVHVFRIDASDDVRLLGNDDESALFVLGVSEETIVVDLHFPRLVSELNAKSDVR